jgi:hypothetical protein
MSLQISEKYVQYVGTADVRVIRDSDWLCVGIQHPTVEWNEANRWKIACSRLSVSVLEYCSHDPNMVFVTG